VLGLERDQFYLRLAQRSGTPERRDFETLIGRRAAREPLAYITGLKEFWSLDFIVAPAVLIPRPETESLVELALNWARELPSSGSVRILDIGTGSGALAVTLAKHLSNAEIWAVDISHAVLDIARANARLHDVEGRMRFRRGDLFGALSGSAVTFELIVSNPPYIRTADLELLAPEIRDWEPVTALDGGADGIEFYRRIIGQAADHLNDGGRILLEVGADSAAAVVNFLAATGSYAAVSVHQDYAGRDRAVAAIKGAHRG